MEITFRLNQVSGPSLGEINTNLHEGSAERVLFYTFIIRHYDKCLLLQ